MKYNKGFTLIEILLALTIFAILATITSSTLYYSFNARTQVNIQANQLNDLQMAISIIQQDTTQAINRPIRGNEMRLFPAVIGQGQYFEFTRGGFVNPQSTMKRSTLKRVAFVCSGDKLLHRTWNTLDAINRKSYQDRTLLTNLNECAFSYFSQNLQTLSDWREQTNEPFPKSVQVNLDLKDWGKISLLFTIPGGLYAPP